LNIEAKTTRPEISDKPEGQQKMSKKGRIKMRFVGGKFVQENIEDETPVQQPTPETVPSNRLAVAAFGTNPMMRGLQANETLQEKKIDAFDDGHGDTWHRHEDLVRNDKHPYSSAHKAKKGDKAPEDVKPYPISAWHNKRTGEVHEGSVRLGTHGTGWLSDYDGGTPRCFHISHYDHHKGK
jgi:hypothetical protein